MTKIFTLFLFFFCWASQGQNTIGTLINESESFDSYTLFSPNFSTQTYLINNCGSVINQWSSQYKTGGSVYLLKNGNLLRVGADPNAKLLVGAAGGIIELYSWEGDLLWKYTYSTDVVSQHHDLYSLPNGNILMLAVTIMTKEEAVQAGRDPSQIIGNLYNEQILELEPVGTNQANVVWEWNITDHLIQDFDLTKDNFGVVENSPELLDINYGITSGGLSNWLHFNSLQYNESLDQIILSSRNLSEVYIIDHSTSTSEAAQHVGGAYGNGGDFLYRWGNDEAYKHGTDTDKKLFGQHYAHWISDGLTDAGKIMIFNNGRGRGYSSLDIINPVMSSPGVYEYNSTTGFSPGMPEWSYIAPNDPVDFFSPILSSGQRLPNGNTLICEGTSGHFFEIDPVNTIVWEYINPENAMGIGVQGAEKPDLNYVFRALKYSPDYSGFDGRDLIPSEPIEQNFEISEVCDFAAPMVTELFPVAESNEVVTSTSELRITFDEPIQYQGGDVILRRVDDNSFVQAGLISTSEKMFFISLGTALENLTSYYLEIPHGAITDFSNNAFAGYSDENGWSFKTVELFLSLTPALGSHSVLVYPNPSTGLFSVDMLTKQKSVSVTISDLSGRMILSLDYFDTAQLDFRLPAKTKAGIYFLTLKTTRGSFSSQLILNK